MEEDTLLVCRKTGKTGEDSNGDNSNEYLLLEHNNFLTVISKEVALRYQPAANLLKDAISDSVLTSCNYQHLLRLSYLVRIIEVVRTGKSIR